MFASKIKWLMREKKITVRALAERADISIVTINKARQDSGISECRLSTLGRIAQALEVKTKDLYEEE